MYDTTFFGLNQWNKQIFENLGWMILAHKHNHNDSTDAYIVNIRNLGKAIDEKIQQTENKDKKKDLNIMKKNLDILLKHCLKDFKKSNIKHQPKKNKASNVSILINQEFGKNTKTKAKTNGNENNVNTNGNKNRKTKTNGNINENGNTNNENNTNNNTNINNNNSNNNSNN